MMDQKWYERGLKSRGLFTSKRAALKQQKNIQKWVRDLETTTVAQGQNALSFINKKREQEDCCLGRACYVLQIPHTPLDDNASSRVVVFENCTSGLPLSAQKKLALSTDVGNFSRGLDSKYISTLASLNDQGATFLQIASFVRGAFLSQTGTDLDTEPMPITKRIKKWYWNQAERIGCKVFGHNFYHKNLPNPEDPHKVITHLQCRHCKFNRLPPTMSQAFAECRHPIPDTALLQRSRDGYWFYTTDSGELWKFTEFDDKRTVPGWWRIPVYTDLMRERMHAQDVRDVSILDVYGDLPTIILRKFKA